MLILNRVPQVVHNISNGNSACLLDGVSLILLHCFHLSRFHPKSQCCSRSGAYIMSLDGTPVYQSIPYPGHNDCESGAKTRDTRHMLGVSQAIMGQTQSLSKLSS